MNTTHVYRGKRNGRGRGFAWKGMNFNNRASVKSDFQLNQTSPPGNQRMEDVTSNRFKELNINPNAITVQLDLDDVTTQWFTRVKKFWTLLKKSPTVTILLHQYFESCDNPYEQALCLVYNCLDFKDAKPKTLAYLIMEEFNVWVSNLNGKIAHLLTIHIKISAFNIVRQQRSFDLMKLVASIYEMTSDCDIFQECINCMLKEKQYKEASQCAVLLGLQDKFDFYQFLLPLLLQDKLSCVNDFLNESPNHRMDFVVFLDSVLGQQSGVRGTLEMIIMQQEIPDVKWDKLHNKPWRKLIARYMKMFNLPADVSPNLSKKRNEGALQFLLYKRYVEHTFGDESWQEMVKEAVKDDTTLQEELVTNVATYGDAGEALKWAHYYNIDRASWPHSVKKFNDNPEEDRCQQTQSKNSECWDNCSPSEQSYYQLRLPRNSIYLVDNIPAFEYFLYSGLQGVNIVGIDCEWKPSFGLRNNELALMQIATRDAVFILDMLGLGNVSAHLWQKFNELLLSNCDILKLGFNISSDLTIIRQSLPHLGSFQALGFLDLNSLWKQISNNSKMKITLPHPAESSGLSLNTLVQQCFGVPLDKSDQFSNWENRPLRESQLLYAALDAFCLIEVYDVIKQCCEEKEFPFYDTCYQLSCNSQPKKKIRKHQNKPKNEEKEVRPQPPSPHLEHVPANTVKIVCDTMLQGLGKSLRRCGIDTSILETFEDHMQCVRLAIDEHRYILTRGIIFDKLGGYVPSGQCLKVISNDIDEQLKEVLDYYKIVVTKDNVFSRCQACNSNSFIKVSKSTMNALASSNAYNQSQPPVPESYLADEATGFSSDEEYYDDAPPPPCSHSRKWDLYSDENVDVGLCLTKQGAKIQVDAVPFAMLEKIDLFYVCEYCGKVYWDGSHFEKVLSGRLQGIVHV